MTIECVAHFLYDNSQKLYETLVYAIVAHRNKKYLYYIMMTVITSVIHRLATILNPSTAKH